MIIGIFLIRTSYPLFKHNYLDYHFFFLYFPIIKLQRSLLLKKNKISILIFLFLFITINKAQWVEQESGVNTLLRDINFCDSLNGWAVGHNSTILHTTNGGEYWEKQTVLESGIELVQIEIVDSLNAYCIGNRGIYSFMFKTENKGTNWELIKENDSINFYNINFLNKNYGWLTAHNWGNHGEIILTTDGGLNWEVKFLSYEADDWYKAHLFNAVTFTNENVGYVLAQRPSIDGGVPSDIFKTTDGGENWIHIDTIRAPSFGIKALSEPLVWIWGEFKSIFTTDGGDSWQSTDSIVGNDMTFYEENFIWSLNEDGSGVWNFIIYESDDNGMTWDEIYHNTSPNLFSITNYTNKFLWTCGAFGTIVKYSNITSVRKEYTKREPITSVSVYPNPFNPNTKILLRMNERINVKIYVYNIYGAEVRELFNGMSPNKEFSTTWDGKNNKGKNVSIEIKL